jgi:hypothetical protein
MTNKVYRTAMGKPVDIGALLLQNETVRAVGNMSVNARGDVIDSRNKVIDSKNRQIQRQQKRQTNVTKSYQQQESQDTFNDLPEDNDVVVQENIAPTPQAAPAPSSGLAAALARSRAIKQEPLRTSRQIAQEASGVKKI